MEVNFLIFNKSWDNPIAINLDQNRFPPKVENVQQTHPRNPIMMPIYMQELCQTAERVITVFTSNHVKEPLCKG